MRADDALGRLQSVKKKKTKNRDLDRGSPNMFVHHLLPLGSSSDYTPRSTMRAQSA